MGYDLLVGVGCEKLLHKRRYSMATRLFQDSFLHPIIMHDHDKAGFIYL